MDLDTIILIAFWAASLGFLIAALVTLMAWMKVGKSAMRDVLSYIFLGTIIFFGTTIFQILGASFFNIADTSVDFWWHIMFYLAMFFYFLGIRGLTKLGSVERVGNPTAWGIVTVLFLVLVFTIPSSVDTWVQGYMNSQLSAWGLHHFLAFGSGILVGVYLLAARKNLGMIGKAIANPMLIGVIALGLQHLWELLNESWKVVMVTEQQGEGGEKIFLIIAAVSIIIATSKLKALATAQSAPPTQPQS